MDKAPKKTRNIKHTLYLCLVLVICGLLVIVARLNTTQQDAVPVGDRLWKITLDTRFVADKDPSKLHLSLPVGSPFVKVVRQSITHPNITVIRPSKFTDLPNELTAIPDIPGEQQMSAEFTVQESEKNRWEISASLAQKLGAKKRSLFLEDSTSLVISDPQVTESLSSVLAGLADRSNIDQEIYNYVYEKIVLDPKQTFADVPTVFSQMRSNALGKTMVFIAICRAANVPARLVTGVYLKEAIDADFHYWAEVHDGDKWQPFDLEHGYAAELPSYYLAIAYNRETLSYFEDPTPIETSVDIEIVPTIAGVMGKDNKQLIQLIDLSRLDVNTQQLLTVLLILPFGALITQIFRQYVGIHMFGTFSAPLLALAMVYADWITVLVIVAIVGLFGMSGRATIAEGMTRTPRLVVVFTLVALSMTFAVSMMDYLNMNPNSSAVLLPIVILVSLIDRIYSTQEDSGVIITLHRIAWTCIVAFFCYLLFKIEWLNHFVLLHPEIHLFTLSLILLLSLYKDTPLIDRPALEWLREPTVKKSTTKKKNNTSDKTEVP